MKKKLIVGLVILVLLLGGFYLYHSRHAGKPVAPPGSNAAPASTPVSTKKVTIHDYAYSPTDIAVKTGTTVTWTNTDAVGYTVTEDDGKTGGPSSSVIPQSQIYSFRFNKTGLFHYHNSLDPNMTGTVTVTAQ